MAESACREILRDLIHGVCAFRSWYPREPQLEEYVPLCHEGNSGEGDENVCIVIGSNTH